MNTSAIAAIILLLVSSEMTAAKKTKISKGVTAQPAA